MNSFWKREREVHGPFIRYGYFKFANQSRVKLVLTRPHEAESAAPQLFLRLRVSLFMTMSCTFSDLKMQAWKGEGMIFCRGQKIGIIETRAEGMAGLCK